MPTKIEDAVARLTEGVAKFAKNNGAALAGEFERAAHPLLEWHAYLLHAHNKSPAASLLTAWSSSLKETASCISLGLVRPALFSMRTQYELVFGWLFLHTHPVEWQRARRSGDGFPLPGQVRSYLRDYYPGYEARMKLLAKSRVFKDDPYDLLSVHVHARTEVALPVLPELASIVASAATAREAIRLQSALSEFLSDVLVGVFAEDWPGLPQPVQHGVSTRLNPKELEELRK
jgi:hypothetical protein